MSELLTQYDDYNGLEVLPADPDDSFYDDEAQFVADPSAATQPIDMHGVPYYNYDETTVELRRDNGPTTTDSRPSLHRNKYLTSSLSAEDSVAMAGVTIGKVLTDKRTKAQSDTSLLVVSTSRTVEQIKPTTRRYKPDLAFRLDADRDIDLPFVPGYRLTSAAFTDSGDAFGYNRSDKDPYRHCDLAIGAEELRHMDDFCADLGLLAVQKAFQKAQPDDLGKVAKLLEKTGDYYLASGEDPEADTIRAYNGRHYGNCTVHADILEGIINTCTPYIASRLFGHPINLGDSHIPMTQHDQVLVTDGTNGEEATFMIDATPATTPRFPGNGRYSGLVRLVLR